MVIKVSPQEADDGKTYRFFEQAGDMTAAERRNKILDDFKRTEGPVSASALAGRFKVSRQIIVGDIALLRAGGTDITATPRGYVLSGNQAGGLRRQIVCCHSQEQTEEELNICVDYGCVVQDVIVEHPVYGQLTGELQLHSRFEVMQFMERVMSEQAHSLSELTDGVHLHTLICPDEAAFRRVSEKLDEAGILFKESGDTEQDPGES